MDFRVNNNFIHLEVAPDSNPGVSNKQLNKVKDFIIRHPNLFENGASFKFEHGVVSTFNENAWSPLNLEQKDLKTVEKIVKAGQSILLSHDTVAEVIAQTLKENNAPTLYLFSSGGGGHKSAKDARLKTDWEDFRTKVLEKLSDNNTDGRLRSPESLFNYCKSIGLANECDVLHDFLGTPGVMATSQWDRAQAEGDVVKQEKLASRQWLSDIVFSIPIFIGTLKQLIRLKPTTMVSTQAMATPSILYAMRVYNSFFKPEGAEDVKLHLYMTDMPTELSGHFFNSLKGLKARHQKEDHLILYAPKPRNPVDWNDLCGLNEEQVKELDTMELPVRPAFLQAADSCRINADTPTVQIKLSCKEESDLLQELLVKQNIEIDLPEAGVFDYQMNSEDEGYFLMLGSVPTKEAIRDYVDHFIEMAERNTDKNYHLFAFTGKFEKSKNNQAEDLRRNECFYKELARYLNEKELPSNIKILPLSFQDPAQLVSMMLQCNTITRSGGATVMELLVIDAVAERLGLAKKNRYFHAQFVEGRLKMEDRIAVWEKGNFFFIQDEFGDVRVVAIDPQTVCQVIGGIHVEGKPVPANDLINEEPESMARDLVNSELFRNRMINATA